MSVGHIPAAITKTTLFERARERFLEWSKMYTDPNVSVEYMYEDMSASCYCGCPADDFPEAFEAESKKEEPVKISDNEFKYRDIVFRITRDDIDDKSYIWCDKYNDSDDLVWWVWGAVHCGSRWLIGTDELDKFIDSHIKED